MPARVLAAADCYQAMTQERPHPAALTAEQAADLQAEADAGRLDPEAVSAVLTAAGGSEAPTRRPWPAGLSDREVEVLGLLARGLSTKEVAGRLFISPKTADHHVQHIYTKNGAGTYHEVRGSGPPLLMIVGRRATRAGTRPPPTSSPGTSRW